MKKSSNRKRLLTLEAMEVNMNKKFTIICLLTFLLGCAGGGVLAYANHQKGLESQSLIASISQTQSDWEVEQFIREQEEQRPEGLEESQIATGSRYTGITYNNVSVATEKKEEAAQNKKGTVENNSSDTVSDDKKKMGRVSIQNGSLNIRSENSIGDNVIGQAYKDELLEIVQQDGKWYRIVTANGVQGYVSATYVEIINE